MGSKAEYDKSSNEDSIKPSAEYDKSSNEDSIKLSAEYDKSLNEDSIKPSAEYEKSSNEDSIKLRAEYDEKSPTDDAIKTAVLNLQMNKQNHNHESDMKDKDLGLLGRLFGGGLHASKNITALICLILLVVAVVFSFVVYFGDCNKDKLIEYFWDTITPIITLSLGYLFGRK